MASNDGRPLMLYARALAINSSALAGLERMNASPVTAQALSDIARTLRGIAGDIDKIAQTVEALLVGPVPNE